MRWRSSLSQVASLESKKNVANGHFLVNPAYDRCLKTLLKGLNANRAIFTRTNRHLVFKSTSLRLGPLGSALEQVHTYVTLGPTAGVSIPLLRMARYSL